MLLAQGLLLRSWVPHFPACNPPGVLVVLVGGVSSVPIVLIRGEAAQQEMAQVVFGDDPRGPSSVHGHRIGPCERLIAWEGKVKGPGEAQARYCWPGTARAYLYHGFLHPAGAEPMARATAGEEAPTLRTPTLVSKRQKRLKQEGV